MKCDVSGNHPGVTPSYRLKARSKVAELA